MTAMSKTFTAIDAFNAKDFCGMTPMEIMAWWRKEVCPAFRAVEAEAQEIWDSAPSVHGRSTQTQLLNNDKLAYSLSLLLQRRDIELEKAAKRSHNRMAA